MNFNPGMIFIIISVEYFTINYYNNNITDAWRKR